MTEAIKKYVQIDTEKASDEELQKALTAHTIELTGSFSRGKAIYALFDHLVPEHLQEPTWIIDYPREVSPLSKEHRTKKDFVERYEGYIAGKEVCDGWSEITDALDQRARFESEQQNMREGNAEAQLLDEDFLESMEYGMPPLGGIGIGIDRLTMIFTDTDAIKEIIAFPTLRPTEQQLAMTNKLLKKTTKKKAEEQTMAPTSTKIPSRDQSEKLLNTYMKDPSLLLHSHMVAQAMEAYAQKLGEDAELWYATGLLHDLDWEAFPDEHPNKAVTEFLHDYPAELRLAIQEHAPDRTGVQTESKLGRYLFACDELSGLMRAASLMREDGFTNMEVKSIKKKIKDKAFARNVSREDIQAGFDLIGATPEEHIQFLIDVFKK
jgi:predicted hydrolase (HD superfamily)